MSDWLEVRANNTPPDYHGIVASRPLDFEVQLALSATLGSCAFLTFCILRPKWADLYAARKRTKNAAARLPELPDSMFGWIPVLNRISEEEVLSSAGLDAYVFLAFFRYAIKLLTIILFFAMTVILPINGKYTGQYGFPGHFWDHPRDEDDGDDGHNSTATLINTTYKKPTELGDQNYLWMYVFFVYFFTFLALYLLVIETRKIIRIRQAYLGTQATVTDRTLRLSGIPTDMRSEETIKIFVENLGIGKVENVTLCRDWRRLDSLVNQRMKCLRRLEEAWSAYVGSRKVARNPRSLGLSIPPPPPISRAAQSATEYSQLLTPVQIEQADVGYNARKRPTVRIWFGRWNLQSKKIDAIDYYEEKIRQYDEMIEHARTRQVFNPTPLAFVTMETVASCQMAVQAILDPRPGQLLASLAPAPADVIWKNTYMSRRHRMFRSWTIMIFIGFMTIFWAALVAPIALSANPQTLGKILPGLEDFLLEHKVIKSLMTTGLPTLVISLLGILVPFVYAYLASLQGITSRSEVELSIISKNFFFTFFSLFVVFTSFGTFANFWGFFENLREALKDTTAIALALAKAVKDLIPFYENLIVLQGLGLLPFRLLEFGVVATYPVLLLQVKTPRDYAELVQPPVFNYGFFLPQTMLIFVICLAYSVMPQSWMVVLCGLIYFWIGGFIYKYQLLYAMDHRQHSTGRAWPMVCNRVITGLVVFQLVMMGFLALNTAFTRSTLVIPAIVGTIWFTVYFQRTYDPLMKFIALRSIDRPDHIDLPTPAESRYDVETNYGRAVDTDSSTGLRYINPNLYEPLEKLWIIKNIQNGST